MRVIPKRVAHELYALTHGLGRHDQPRPYSLHQLIERLEVRCRPREHQQEFERQLGERNLDFCTRHTLAADVDHKITHPVAVRLRGNHW